MRVDGRAPRSRPTLEARHGSIEGLMAGRYPNPDGQRRNRNERSFDWTVLPLEGRQGPPPVLPAWRPWTEETRVWWAELWSTPQAAMWDQTGRSMHALALLHHELMLDQYAETKRAHSITAEMRAHEDRHGLTPKAMLQLRWKVSSTPSDGSGKVLSIVPREVADRVEARRPDPDRMPSKRDRKVAWVDWAVAWGADRAAAELLSKADLIREFSSVAATAPSPAVPGPRPTSRAADRLRAHAEAKPKPARKPRSKPKGKR